MSDAVILAIVHGVIWGTIVGAMMVLFPRLIEESRRWRRLIQLYLEKQVNAPLPVDTDEDEETVSALHLPPDDLDELEREDELEAEAQAERLI